MKFSKKPKKGPGLFLDYFTPEKKSEIANGMIRRQNEKCLDGYCEQWGPDEQRLWAYRCAVCATGPCRKGLK